MTFVAGQKVRASQMPGYTCTSSTRPTGHSGQIIYETDTGMTAIYTASGWRYLAPTGEILSDAEFNAASNQAVANTTQPIVAFGTTNQASPLVVRGTSGAGHYFRLQRAGRWIVTASIRWGSSASGGERYNLLLVGGVGRASQGASTTGTPVTHNLTSVVRIAVGAQNTAAADVHIEAYQASTGGVSQNLEFNNTTGWNRINLSWIGP